MSDLELEQAAIAPHRWIELCGTSKKQHPDDPGAILWPRTTRVIMPVDLAMQPMPDLFLVPGGRFMVIVGNEGLFVWDLGYVSNAYCTLIASVRLDLLEGGSDNNLFYMVQATPDDMGLIILVSVG